MPIDRRSRYYGLPTYEAFGRTTTTQRLVPNTAEGPFIDHVLTAGETLDQLALRYYGRDDLWWRIADANPMRVAMDFAVGDVIRIPISRAQTRGPRRRP